MRTRPSRTSISRETMRAVWVELRPSLPLSRDIRCLRFIIVWCGAEFVLIIVRYSVSGVLDSSVVIAIVLRLRIVLS